MAYGISILDSNGKTIFNSSHYCELIAYKATVTSGSWLSIPGWCYGQDQDVAGTSLSVANMAISAMTATGGAYSTNYQIAFPYNGATAQDYTNANWDQYNVQSQYLTSLHGTYGVTYTGTYPNLVFDYSNAYRIYNCNKDVSSLRTSVSNRTITPYLGMYSHNPTIYVRPVSTSYSGDFCLQQGLIGDNPLTVGTDRYNRRVRVLDKASGNNTFEVVVAMPAKHWGGISGTKAHQAGTNILSGNYLGTEAYTEGGQKFHSASTAGQFLTYSTLARPSKVLLAKGVSAGANAVSTTSLGSLTTSTTKRYCRMTGTQYGHIEYVSGVSSEYRQHYSWASNNSVGLKWTTIATATSPAHVFYSGRATIILDNYDGKQLFAIADFGLGM